MLASSCVTDCVWQPVSRVAFCACRIRSRDLWDKNLVPLNRLTALEREAARIASERAQLAASTAAARGKVAEIEMQIIQIDNDLISDVSKEMRDVGAKIGEFVERRVSAEDQLKRIDLRAPQDGMVHQLSVHTVGGVVAPGEPVILIVPRKIWWSR